MTTAVIIMAVLCVLAAISIGVRLAEIVVYNRHQREWNNIRDTMMETGASFGEIHEAYYQFTNELRRRKDFFWVCIPKE